MTFLRALCSKFENQSGTQSKIILYEQIIQFGSIFPSNEERAELGVLPLSWNELRMYGRILYKFEKYMTEVDRNFQ